jgi:hypothetical protein
MTNRGSSNHGLIRQGQSQASVEISLYNRGENAFKPEVFFQLKPYLHVKEMCLVLHLNKYKRYYFPWVAIIMSK